MNGHEDPGIRRTCTNTVRSACGGRPQDRLRRRQLSWLAAATSQRGHRRSRCMLQRSRPGLLADLGCWWFRQYPYSELSWRTAGPRR